MKDIIKLVISIVKNARKTFKNVSAICNAFFKYSFIQTSIEFEFVIIQKKSLRISFTELFTSIS